MSENKTIQNRNASFIDYRHLKNGIEAFWLWLWLWLHRHRWSDWSGCLESVMHSLHERNERHWPPCEPSGAAQRTALIWGWLHGGAPTTRCGVILDFSSHTTQPTIALLFPGGHPNSHAPPLYFYSLWLFSSGSHFFIPPLTSISPIHCFLLLLC